MASPSSDRNAVQSEAVQLLRLQAGAGFGEKADTVAREEPLEIRVRGRNVVVTMRTPGNDQQLAAGFLFTEGVIHKRNDIIEITGCTQADDPENVLNVFLAPDVDVDFERLNRHVFASSSCGVCGKASIEAVRVNFPPIESAIEVDSQVLLDLPRRMRAAQHTFNQTGGLHAAAVFDTNGALVALCEDVGRHNAVDKAIGQGFISNQLPFGRHVLLVSGRASFEIMQKALAARIPIVCAVSAPSSLAVEFAKENGQTLIGFLRQESMNIYSRPDRIQPC